MPSETVKVVVRVRPFNQREKDNQSKSCIRADELNNQIELIKTSDNEIKSFSYDYVFGLETTQNIIYEKTAFQLIENVVEGYNGTIFAYGQTGCGKTFTMIGNPNSDKDKGIIPRAFDQIINIINNNSDLSKKYLLRCSYIEIYNEEIHDLLGKDVKQRLDLKEQQNGLSVKDLSINIVKTQSEMDKYMAIGTANRSVRATAMNKESSRSHCIFTVYVECAVTQGSQERFTAGKLNLVDLAGSERQQKTQATGDGLKEATKINLSLSALGNVISALVDGKTQHIPYRDSKLTRLLQDSLGGNTKTVMITAVSPSDFNYDESLSSLRYASRAKQIKNQPKINQDPKDALLKEQAEEIQKLKALLLKQPGISTLTLNQQQVNGQQTTQLQQELEGIKKQNQNESQKALQLQQELEGIKKQNQNALNQVQEYNVKLKTEQMKFQEEIRIREEQANMEREARLKLEELIKEKEQMIIPAGKGKDEDKSKYAKLRKKVDKEKLEHQKLIEERDKQENEIYEMEQRHETIQQEVESLRKAVKQLRKKYKEKASDNIDLEKEHGAEKQDLLQTIRDQQSEISLLTAIINMLLSFEQLETIKAVCELNTDTLEYSVPPFIVKNKIVSFPKLQAQQAAEFIEQEKISRVIEIQQQGIKQETKIISKKDLIKIPESPLKNRQKVTNNSINTSPFSHLNTKINNYQFIHAVNPQDKDRASENNSAQINKQLTTIGSQTKIEDKMKLVEQKRRQYMQLQQQIESQIPDKVSQKRQTFHLAPINDLSNNSKVMASPPQKTEERPLTKGVRRRPY